MFEPLERQLGLVLDNLCQVAGVEKPQISRRATGAVAAVITVEGFQVEIWCGPNLAPSVCIRIGPEYTDKEVFENLYTLPVSEEKAAQLLAVWVKKE
jgi:hypothetical protein